MLTLTKRSPFIIQKLPEYQSVLSERFYSQNVRNYDLVVIGGGIVGCASARELQIRHPNLKIALLDKEKCLATHQSSSLHNSGVIHAGIYYQPGSLKAKLCVEGMKMAYKYYECKGIPYKRVGKLIVAVNECEIPPLMNLYDRAIKNEVSGVELIEGKDICQFAKYCRGVRAIWSPNTGIVDFSMVANEYGRDLVDAGGTIHLNHHVIKFTNTPTNSEYPVSIHSTGNEPIQSKYVLTCGGLYSDKLAAMTGCSSNPKIIPVRGEYLELIPEKQYLVETNIYPVPDPRFPFLGVHFTPRMDGSIWMGPNAVLAFHREGYSYAKINLIDLFETITYSGFRKLAYKHMEFGMGEFYRSIFIGSQLKRLQEFIPELCIKDVKRCSAGVRAQALEDNGTLVEDFVLHTGSGTGALCKRVLHCRNAPSPGATSSLAIGEMMADKIDFEFFEKK